MIIVGSQFIYSYKRNNNVRRRIFDYENELADFALPFRTFAIPDDEDPLIPRFEADSKSGFSKIQVSQNRLTLATSYNEDFGRNNDKIKSYLENKNNHFQKLIEKEEVEYVALILQLTKYYQTEQEVNTAIKKFSSALKNQDDFIDFSLGYSFKHFDSYFINVRANKFIEKEFKIHGGQITDIPTGNIRHGVAVILDVNSRLHYENFQQYRNSIDEILFKLTFEIVSKNNLENYLKGNIIIDESK